MRLVVFDALKRAPAPVFNEKVFCGLGRGLKRTGSLDADGVVSALTNLARFTGLVRSMGVTELTLLATAAVREADNGADFVGQIAERFGLEVQVLSGKAEARLSALGVISGMPDADGIMGDLGGGSLELVELKGGKIGRSATLGLGPLRLIELCHGDRKAAKAEINRQLETVEWLTEAKGRTFYPVGGSWRGLARIHIKQTKYPLTVVHGYEMQSDALQSLASLVSGLGAESLTQTSGVNRRRVETLPFGALVLEQVLRRSRFKRIVFSSCGLREGHLYDLLPKKEQAKDPLIAIAQDISEREGRFPDLGQPLADWSAPLFENEDKEEALLRLAACHLSDFAWREHPEYRAEQALFRILHHPFIGVNHSGRAFMAYAVFLRYGGALNSRRVASILPLMKPKMLRRAQSLGLGLRLAFMLSGGMRGILERTSLAMKPNRVNLVLPSDGSILAGDVVERRLKALADVLELKAGVVVED
ncbi:Ppx/GppA family phosphatase [Denitrobaculum tricleocarpae]|uniref:Ppx/GppA family phosphatase n=2 Tax=Denitrobaculum tricleocarpae TaxID=2591009 RepID=A0A545TUR0_9PROT|nr:Ppx/GppA family phosphatase [Denitrobaculum tricleocarpae]